MKPKEKLKTNDHITSALFEKKFEEDIVADIKKEFNQRQENRKNFEKQWQMNTNFLLGNQYCTISSAHEIEDYEKQYFWQEREVYNHIAPIVEVRIARLCKIRPEMTVVPNSMSEEDVNSAKVTKDIIKYVNSKFDMPQKIKSATVWSEICGTSFYKINWNSNKGNLVGYTDDGLKIAEGDVEITAIPPYEIFPEDENVANINEQRSIIHAKAYNTDTIKDIWGIDVKGEDINVFSLDNVPSTGGLGYLANVPKVTSSVKHNSAIVIEKYEAPSIKHPEGRLIIVAGNKLLYMGSLPYKNANDNKRTFPFVKQVAIEQAGSFWGTSIIERIIPVQRAYNAVKNRKHEFIRRYYF